MAYEFRKATRTNVKTITGFAGGTGSGKTFTSLAYAKGISAGKRFGLIDTENGRASMYADLFDFDVLEICAPFTPDNYFDAIKAAEKAQYPAIVVDQFSHEWEGEGGILDEQIRIVDEMVERSRKAGDSRKDWELVEAHNMRGWAEAKKPHKKMVTHLTQMNCHLILNFRAEDKIEIAKEKNEQGKLKTIIRPKQTLTGIQGWVPICERRLPFELTASFLFIADRPGFPIPIKLQEQHKPFFPLDKPISEESGHLMAEWARGGITEKTVAVKDPPKAKTITMDQARAFAKEFDSALADKVKPVGKTLLEGWLSAKGYAGLSAIPPADFELVKETAIQYAKEQF